MNIFLNNYYACEYVFRSDDREDVVRVKSIGIFNDKEIVCQTQTGELWTYNYKDDNQEAERIFFDNRITLSVSSSRNFSVVLARKLKKQSASICSKTIFDAKLSNSLLENPKDSLKKGSLKRTHSDSCLLKLNANDKNHSGGQLVKSLQVLSVNDLDWSFVEEHFEPVTHDLSRDESVKEEKKNFLTHTESARQFFAKPLSWVSSHSSDHELEFTDKSTRIIKQNVSNVANFVYEGVKTVVTLSKQVSRAGPDILELSGVSSAEDESELEVSLSSDSSFLRDYEGIGNIDDRVAILSHFGNDLMESELWTWGSAQYGQLGIGIGAAQVLLLTVKTAFQPIVVKSLRDIGIIKVECGKSHAIAMTLDGRVYTWGRNNVRQISPNNCNDQFAPQLFQIPGDKALDVSAGENHSVVLTTSNIIYLGSFK